MSIKEIEQKIIEQAEAEAKKIEQENNSAIKELEKTHAQKKAALAEENKLESEQKAAAVKRAVLVPARLKAKKELLEAKQSIVAQIYSEAKKSKGLTEAEANKLREETEVKTAQILFE